MPLLEAMYTEFKDLSRKRPDGAASAQKVKMANRLLDRCREILANEESIDFLDPLNDDELPSYSDVALVLSQYTAAMGEFKAEHCDDLMGWFIEAEED